MLDRVKNIFIVGIKGVAMANLALILKKMGKNVAGADVAEEFITDEILKKNKINYTSGFSPQDLPKNTQLIIYSAAHQGINNPQVKEGLRRGIKVYSQAEVLGEMGQKFKTTIAVCGCHGKTTTASLLAYSLIKLGAKPSYLVGSSSFSDCEAGGYYNPASESYFVVEADEYGVNPPENKTPKFLFLKPNYIICTNIDFDHPDVYKNLEDTKKAFFQFFKTSMNRFIGGKIFACQDDKNLKAVLKQLPRRCYLTYGFSSSSDFQIIKPNFKEDGSSFEISSQNKSLGQFSTALFGDKNISNATAVVVFLLYLGYSVNQIKKSIKNFTGAKRRFEKIALVNNIYLFDDYAHHPAEISATIEAARKRFPQRRIIIIFQPHTYSRTKAFLYQFGQSLSLADFSFILPIFASAREKKDQFKISSHDIVTRQEKNNLFFVEGNDQLIKQLTKVVQPGDVIFTMGAGDIYKLKDDIIKVMKRIN